jgi:hypothetical protein
MLNVTNMPIMLIVVMLNAVMLTVALKYWCKSKRSSLFQTEASKEKVLEASHNFGFQVKLCKGWPPSLVAAALISYKTFLL